MSISPNPADASDGPVTVTATFRFTDETGVADKFIYKASHGPSGQEFGLSNKMTRISGDANDGIYTATVTLPGTAAPGQWSFQLGSLEDLNGNNARNGWTYYGFVVENGPVDVDPPQVELVSISPNPADASDGPVTVTATFRFTDETGVADKFIYKASHGPSGQEFGLSNKMTRISGDANDGIYTATVTLPGTAAPGQWSFQLGSLEDLNGNNARNGWTYYGFVVTNGTVDVDPPQVELVSISPNPADASDGPVTVTATFRFTDETGVADKFIYKASHGPSGQEFGLSNKMTRISGDANDGIYTATVTLPGTAAPGQWSFQLGSLEDLNGNNAHNGWTYYGFEVVDAPDAPTTPSVSPGDGQATVSWMKPAANGSPITGYMVTRSPGATTQTVAGADTTTVTIEGLANGIPYTFTVKAINALGVSAASPPSAQVIPRDAAAPETAITHGPTQGSATRDTTPTFRFASSETGSIFQCRLDAATIWTSCATPFTTDALAPGSHTFRVRAKDAAGNFDPTAVSRTFTIDTAAPDTTITAGPAQGSATRDTTPTFRFASSETGSIFQCRLDDATIWTSCATPFTTDALAPGSHTFRVRAKDAAGNFDPTAVSRTFTIDTAAPDTTITAGPAQGSATRDTTPTFRFASSETGSIFQCRLDDATIWTSCATPFTTDALAPGSHTFRVRAKDAAGNFDPTAVSRTFTVTP